MAIRTGSKVLVTWVDGLVTTQYTGTVTAVYGRSYPRTFQVRDERGVEFPVAEYRCERLRA